MVCEIKKSVQKCLHMKNKKYIVAGFTLAYSYLFYYQGAGINFLIFNILLIAGLYMIQLPNSPK